MARKKRQFRREKYIVVSEYTGKNGNKSYYFTVKFDYAAMNGKTKRYSKSFNSRDYMSALDALDAACEHRDIMRAKLATDEALDKDTATVGDIWNCFEEAMALSHNTYMMYYYLYKIYIKDKYETTRIADITEYDINQSIKAGIETRSQQGLSKIRTTWHYLYKIANQKKIINYDLTTNIQLPKSKKIQKEHDSTVSAEDLVKLIEYLRTYDKRGEERKYNYNMISYALLTMWYTGCRPAEIFALRKDQYREDGLHVGNRVTIDKDNKTKISPPKTEESIRVMHLTDDCRQVIEEAMTLSDSEYLFPDYQGRLFNTSKVSEWISKAARACKIDFRSYDLRHEFATGLLTGKYGEAVDPRTVQELMGHKYPTMTLRYARSNTDLKKSAISLIENPLSNAKNDVKSGNPDEKSRK